MPAVFVELVHSSRGAACSHVTLGWCCLYLHGWPRSAVPVGEPGINAQRRKHEEMVLLSIFGHWPPAAFLEIEQTLTHMHCCKSSGGGKVSKSHLLSLH